MPHDRAHGATGWTRGHPLEFLYRYVRMTTIIEGTSEVQKVIIARSMGLNRRFLVRIWRR
ncbi:acyl-CoA dehydrogenase family protein [Kitasatospora sp. NPDC058162]|uniref:acyl-CoA dehydrogenase family protein n=1 Tax=Kitasatospora sp. NPDC058162 TaxID=3346362 RepID=UPI0036DE4CD1